MRNINKTEKISDILNTFTFGENNSKGKSLSDTIKQSTIFSFWGDIAGAKFAKYSKPIKIKYSKLYVSAKSPVIVQELNLLKAKILKKVNTYSNALNLKITDIVFDYKNYDDNINEEYGEDIELDFYDDEILEGIELDKNYELEISKNINKINFLTKEQKQKLISKITNVKKAQIKRLHD